MRRSRFDVERVNFRIQLSKASFSQRFIFDYIFHNDPMMNRFIEHVVKIRRICETADVKAVPYQGRIELGPNF